MEIEEFASLSPAVYVSASDPVVVSQKQIDQLIDAARSAPDGRARLLLHADVDDTLHEMLIALPQSSCDHPHINFKSGKSFLALSGQFAVMRCSDDGARIDPLVLSGGAWPGARLVRLRSPTWHTIIPLAGDTVFLETIIGPFTGNRFAQWFPDKQDVAARRKFVERFKMIARAKVKELERGILGEHA
jgi:cupin fold WbuC family metalloprotein